MMPITNMTHSEDITKITPALIAAMKGIGGAKKDAENKAFTSKYSDLAAVLEACRGPLLDNGIAIMQPPATIGEGEIAVTTILLHESCQWMACTLNLTPKDASPQAAGSVITYGRRYSLQPMLGMPSEDDDGNAASQQGQQRGTKDAAKAVADRKLHEMRSKADPSNDPPEIAEQLNFLREMVPGAPEALLSHIEAELFKAGGTQSGFWYQDQTAAFAKVHPKGKRVAQDYIDLSKQLWKKVEELRLLKASADSTGEKI